MLRDRTLGYIETICHLGHEELSGAGNIAGFIKIHGPLNLDIFKKASEYLYNRHPLLRATICFEKETNNYCFKFTNQFSDIPIEFKEVDNDEEANKLYELELDRLFNTSNHLWRMLLLKNSRNRNIFYIIPSMHHAVADGTSSAYLINEFLNYCHSIYYEKKIDVISLPSHLSLEELIPNSPTWEEYLSGNQSMEWGSMKKNDEGAECRKYISNLLYDQYQPIGKRQTHCLGHILQKDQLSSLKLRCKKESTSVNAALGAALLKGAQKQVSEPANLMLYTAINLRKKCLPSIPIDELGCYASVIKEQYSNVDNNINDFWELARKYRSDLQNELTKSSELFPKNTRLSDIRKTFNTCTISEAKEFNLNYMLTNMGKVEFTLDISPFKLEEMRFVGSRQAGDQVMVVAVFTINNRMFLNFAYTYPLLSDETARIFFNNFLTNLFSNSL